MLPDAIYIILIVHLSIISSLRWNYVLLLPKIALEYEISCDHMVARTKMVHKANNCINKRNPSKYGQMKSKKSLFIIGLNSICYFREH